MTNQTNQELAYQMQGILETLGANFATLEKTVGWRSPACRLVVREFGKMLKQWEDLTREAAQRLSEEKQ